MLRFSSQSCFVLVLQVSKAGHGVCGSMGEDCLRAVVSFEANFGCEI